MSIYIKVNIILRRVIKIAIVYKKTTKQQMYEYLNIQMNNNKLLTNELSRKREENYKLQEEIIKLKNEIEDLKKNVRIAYMEKGDESDGK